MRVALTRARMRPHLKRAACGRCQEREGMWLFGSNQWSHPNVYP